MVELLINPVNSPVKDDSRAGIFSSIQAVSLSFLRQKLPVNIGQVSIGDDQISFDDCAIFQLDAFGPVPSYNNPGYRFFILELNTQPGCRFDQFFHDPVHTTFREQSALCNFNAGQHGKKSRSLIRILSDIDILECESHPEIRAVKISFDVAGVPDPGF